MSVGGSCAKFKRCRTLGISNHRDHFVNETQNQSCRLYPKKFIRYAQPAGNTVGTLLQRCSIAVHAAIWIQWRGKARKSVACYCGFWMGCLLPGWSRSGVRVGADILRSGSESIKNRRLRSPDLRVSTGSFQANRGPSHADGRPSQSNTGRVRPKEGNLRPAKRTLRPTQSPLRPTQGPLRPTGDPLGQKEDPLRPKRVLSGRQRITNREFLRPIEDLSGRQEMLSGQHKTLSSQTASL